MDDAQKRTQLAEENARLRAFCDLAARWLLTLEQEHEKASHQDEDTRQISSQTCHVCAGIDALWQAIKEGALMGGVPRRQLTEDQQREFDQS